ncbi:MFS general substrate transporter [Aspergillus sclerotiicarbonarius CBS 121057]|uniref:MFS general substrate transporter n=1 Tax=Aspergillus sclerotiicarbonarius (strain CBS 121057 / IBT 28362) TaxID=1448318 RepID=A0A319EDT4_ASPSB|nr:MFS general substrate transporter [Aspergillus sclerotiicarbonarius CBS 121057]
MLSLSINSTLMTMHPRSLLNTPGDGSVTGQAAYAASSRLEEGKTFRHILDNHHHSQGNDASDTSNRGIQGIPSELSGFTGEIVFVLLCSMGLFLFGVFLGDVLVNQLILPRVLHINESNTPWLVGSFLLANGVAVIIAGPIADLSDPKLLMTLAFGWLVIWNIVGVFSLRPQVAVLFFVARAMQGLAVGVLQATSMSLLGRVYTPGIRKNRMFSLMSAMTPVGFFIGCLKGGALAAHLSWNFAANAILCSICTIASIWCIPSFKSTDSTTLSLKIFDILGALCAAGGCGLVIFGLTQGAPSGWSPYTYSLIIMGLLFFGLFYLAEQRATRPLIDNRLWTAPGFTPLAISYFLGYGAYIGGWMFLAVRFFLSIQSKPPILVALYLTPNLISGIAATWIVSRTLHIFPGHWILAIGMLAFTMGPIFFLPQTPNTTYWALSMPGIFLVTFGPDMTFAAASIFITSSVPKSFQGSAGSLLITVQNISAAIVTAIADTIGERVRSGRSGYDLDLMSLRVIWWFSLGLSVLGAVVCVGFVRIPRAEEKEHVG